jgi:hypothetical protein
MAMFAYLSHNVYRCVLEYHSVRTLQLPIPAKLVLVHYQAVGLCFRFDWDASERASNPMDFGT